MSLSNKVAIVTGSSSGIGAAIAIKFAKEGAQVAMVGRNQTKLNNVVQQLEKTKAKVLVIVADVTKEEDAKRIIKETLNHFGKLDILVNNAGIGITSSILGNSAMEVFDNVMATNLRSAVHLTYLATPHLIQTKGNIVNISSVAACAVLGPTSFAYSTSKAALDHFSRNIARELSSKGVRVNTINPGPVKTDILENAGIDEAYHEMAWETMKDMTALKRIGDAEEVADLTAFVASDKAKSVTGSSFVNDNGVLLKPQQSCKASLF